MKFVFWFIFLSSIFLQSTTELVNVDCTDKYIIIVDGGSSGTRLHVFQFEAMQQYPKLIETKRFKSKIAFSKFSNIREDWSIMRIMLNNFTTNALSVIPEPCYKTTPFHVQVTAGVRQIERSMSNKILNEIRKTLFRTPFEFKTEFVDILSTVKEGRLAWISINFLLNKLQPTNSSSTQTVGMLDLGGGSTQISFATKNIEILKDTFELNIFGNKYNLYTKGYDYMGINEIRIRYLDAQNCLQSTCLNQTVRSPCIHPSVKAHFHFGNRTLLAGGRAINENRRFCYCYGKGLQMISLVKPIRKYFDSMEFVGISAYFYIITAAKNILVKKEGGLFETSVRDIIFRAIELCKNPIKSWKLDTFDHFLCLDMSYVVSLLHNGYFFEWYDKISVAQKIKDISLSWALGYAISVL